MEDRVPRRSRPSIEGYNITADEQGMLEWRRVEELLAAAPIYWLATASAEGDPHAIPIWGTWVGGAVYFDGYYEKTRWGRNLAANPRIVVHIESGNLVVMLKGRAKIVNLDAAAFKQLKAEYRRKYKQAPPTAEGVYSVRPAVAFAWDNTDYGRTATRWHFSSDEDAGSS